MINGGNQPGRNIADESAFFGLGSNLADRRANLREAVRRVEELGVEVTRESSVYETEPVGCLDQPWFLNQVIEGRVIWDSLFDGDQEMAALIREIGDADPVARRMLQAGVLLEALLRIERDMGRKRVIVDGPRIIDIDILLLGSSILAQTKDEAGERRVARAEIIVPHPRMHLRRFVLEPMCEIAPDLIHPSLGKTFRELLDALEDPSVVRLYEPRSISRRDL